MGQGNFLRVYDASTGTFGKPIPLVPDETSTTVGIALAVNGDYRRVTFTEENGIVLPECSEACGRDLFVQALSATGEPTGSPVQVNQEDSTNIAHAVAVLSNGRTLVVWGEVYPKPKGFVIRGRVFDENLGAMTNTFALSGESVAAWLPEAAASATSDVFAVSWAVADEDVNAVAMLNDSGSKLWERQIGDAVHWPSIAFIGERLVFGTTNFVGAPDPTPEDERAGEEAMVRLYDSSGDLVGAPYNVSIPRGGQQQYISLAVSGQDVYATWDSTSLHGMLDFIRMRPRGGSLAPTAADPPLINNAVLGSIETVGFQKPRIAASDNYVAVLYQSEATAEAPHIHSKAKMIVALAGPPPCPVNGDCVDLRPFVTTGPVERRLNIVIRPAAYERELTPGVFARAHARFLRELREHLIRGIFFGARQTREYRDKFNFLIDFTDAAPAMPDTTPAFGSCPGPIDFDDLDDFEMRYPWVFAIGGQQNRDCDWIPGCTPSEFNPCCYIGEVWCADFGVFANDGGYFKYPGGEGHSVFHHEMAHAVYQLVDEYESAPYFPEEAFQAVPQQFDSEQACRDFAVQRGWNPDDCQLGCDPASSDCQQMGWWSAEIRYRVFDTIEECREYQSDRMLDPELFPCMNIPHLPTRVDIPALRDVMKTTGDRLSPADSTLEFAHIDRPYENFQRACEARPLDVLQDPGLTP